LDSLLFEVGEGKWGDVLQTLLGVAALVSNQRAEFGDDIENSPIKKKPDTDWEWMEDDQHGRKSIRTRKAKR
jgi:hypothetical protein